MRNIIKKLVCLLLCGIMVFSVTACKNKDKGETDGGSVSIWSKPSTVTVMRDVEYDQSFRGAAAYEIIAGRGEFEAAQIIITAPAGVTAEYDIEVSDLVCGDEKIDKSYIDVYNEKYIEVNSTKATYSTGLGWYADALLPFEKAVEFGENVVGSEDTLRNQGIYIETFIPRDIPAGDYKGTFTLTIGEEEFEIPAKVTVCNFEVSQESHVAQDWITNYRGFGELDTTYGMQKIYFEKVASYRATVHSTQSGNKDIYEWIQTVRKYTNPNLRDENGNPLIGEKESYLAEILIPSSYHATYGIDRARFDEYISQIVFWSIKDGYDYLAKVGCYPGYIDEPQHNGTWDKVKFACAGWQEYKTYWANDIVAKFDLNTINKKAAMTGENELTSSDVSALSEEFKAKLVKSMQTIGYYVTIHPDDRLDNTLTTQFCAGTGSAITARSVYDIENWTEAEISGNWSYVCGSAQFGYNIDTEPLSQRLFGWFNYDKGYNGFLVWETTMYHTTTWSSEARRNIDSSCDPYETAYKCPSGVGDGYLFYPGKAYDIQGPVASIRAHQYRDSSEEYEYLYLLDNLYKAKGYSIDKILERMCTTLYSEQAVTQDTEIFAKQREALINLILLAQKGVFVTDYTEIGSKINLSVNCIGEEKVTEINGEEVTATANATVSCDILNTDEGLSFKTSSGLKFAIYTCAKAEVIKSTETKGLKVDGGTATADTLNGTNTVRLDFALDMSVEEDRRINQVTFDISKDSVTRSTTYLSSSFYNASNGAVIIELWFMGRDGRTSLADDLVLYPNEYGAMISTRLDCENWSAVRSLEGLRFKVYPLEGQETYTVHFIGVHAAE